MRKTSRMPVISSALDSRAPLSPNLGMAAAVSGLLGAGCKPLGGFAGEVMLAIQDHSMWHSLIISQPPQSAVASSSVEGAST